MRAALLLASLALSASPAYAQASGQSAQTQLRGAYSNVDVTVGQAGDVGATAVAAGNATSVNSDDSNVDLHTDQRMEGDANATANATVWHADGTVATSSAAISNGATATASNGNVGVRVRQIAHGASSARTNVVTSDVGAAASSASAGNNVAALSADHGDIRADIAQASTGAVSAQTVAKHDSGGDLVADAIASANNVNAAGDTTTSLTSTTQSAYSASVDARVDLYAGSANNIVGNATANANTVNVDNQWGYVNARARQNASANVHAEGYVTLGGDFGLASSSAYGVGNSASASNFGSDTALNVAQNNSGDTEANAALAASGNGEQALASSSAYGNVVTGTLCTGCDNSQATLDTTSSQTNTGDVRSTALVQADRARQVAASASAIGNAASYSVNGAH